LTIDEIEARGLAGAVRSDQSNQLARGNGERHILHGHNTAESFSQMLDLQYRVRRWS
jgi:hypothetical protein